MDSKVDALVTVLRAAKLELSNAPLDVATTGTLVTAARDAVDAALAAATKLARQDAALADRNAELERARKEHKHLAKAYFAERVMLPPVENGIDYSARRPLLIERLEVDGFRTRLFWVQSGKYYANRYEGYKHGTGSLRLIHPDNRVCMGRVEDLRLAEGGRLSRTLVQQHAAVIDKVFGEGVAAIVDIKRTLFL